MSDRPPSGEGWVLLAAQSWSDRQFTAFAEIRPFGGKLWARIRFSTDEPAVFIATIEDTKPWDNTWLEES